MQETTEELNATEVAIPWESRTDRPERHVRIAWSARTDIGRSREHNEDKYDFFVPEDPARLALRGRLFSVADGMGGHQAGQVASETALKTVIRSYFDPDTSYETEAILRTALNRANTLIYRAAREFDSKVAGMGTTTVVAIVKEDVITIAHVGDSRAYLLRRGEPLKRLTTDHSWVEEQVRRGNLSREEAEKSPYRNYILRSVGVDPILEPDFESVIVQKDDTILLCSDGLTGMVDDNQIADILGKESPSDAVISLVDAANDAGGKDNITALVLKVIDVGLYNEKIHN
jgi:serine/threonine protein phosphatase PrpC